MTYGGCDLASIWTKRGRQILITPSTAKLDALINLEKPTTRRECQVVIGMVNQLQAWVPELLLKLRGLRKLTGTNTRFKWTPDLDKEWEDMKKAVKKAVALSPLDMSLPLHVHTYASPSIGMGLTPS